MELTATINVKLSFHAVLRKAIRSLALRSLCLKASRRDIAADV